MQADATCVFALRVTRLDAGKAAEDDDDDDAMATAGADDAVFVRDCDAIAAKSSLVGFMRPWDVPSEISAT